jgi:hypothetical protein
MAILFDIKNKLLKLVNLFIKKEDPKEIKKIANYYKNMGKNRPKINKKIK